MTIARAKAVHFDDLEYEFIPPLDAPESWGRPWEKLLAAVQAWQEAGGNQDGQELDTTAYTSEQRPAIRTMANAHRQSTITPDAANETYPFAERRTHTLNIGFPDRRRSGS